MDPELVKGRRAEIADFRSLYDRLTDNDLIGRELEEVMRPYQPDGPFRYAAVAQKDEARGTFFAAKDRARDELRHALDGLVREQEPMCDQAIEHAKRPPTAAEAYRASVKANGFGATIHPLDFDIVRTSDILRRTELKGDLAAAEPSELLKAYTTAVAERDHTAIRWIEEHVAVGVTSGTIDRMNLDDGPVVKALTRAVDEQRATRVPAELNDWKRELDEARTMVGRLSSEARQHVAARPLKARRA